MGKKYSEKKVDYIKALLIADIQNITKALGKVPQYKDYREPNMVRSYFGNWGNFLYEAGLSMPPKKRHKYKHPHASKESINKTRGEFIQRIQKKAVELGRTPIAKEIQGYRSIISFFGTWNRAVEEAGLQPNKRRKNEQVGIKT